MNYKLFHALWRLPLHLALALHMHEAFSPRWESFGQRAALQDFFFFKTKPSQVLSNALSEQNCQRLTILSVLCCRTHMLGRLSRAPVKVIDRVNYPPPSTLCSLFQT